MSNSFSNTQINHFKRQAKQISREETIQHCHALDRIALQNGYTNWSLLIKNQALPAATAPEAVAVHDFQPSHYRFTRSSEEMRVAVRVIRSTRDMPGAQHIYAAIKTQDICHQFVSAQNAIDFAIDYMGTLLSVPRFSIGWNSFVMTEMRSWLPYSVHDSAGGQILVNRNYKPVGLIKKDHVKYDEFSWLHLQLSQHQLDQVHHSQPNKHKNSASLFHDGTAPWRSRENAMLYRDTLINLRAVVLE